MTRPVRSATPILWTGLALGGAAIGLGAAASADTMHTQTGPETLWLAQAEGGEGGEGGEGATHASADDDVAYLASLGFIEGHLTSGLRLYREGYADLAQTHMKHPGDEIYTDLAPMLARRDKPGFEDALAALADTVASNGPVSDADTAFAAVTEATSAAAAIDAAPRTQFDAMVRMTRTAAEEYAVGVTDGQITDLHEYQDAWGFLQVVRQRAETLAASDDANVAAAARTALDALAEADAAFGPIVPDGAVPGGADLLFGAAARIELAALTLR